MNSIIPNTLYINGHMYARIDGKKEAVNKDSNKQVNLLKQELLGKKVLCEQDIKLYCGIVDAIDTNFIKLIYSKRIYTKGYGGGVFNIESLSTKGTSTQYPDVIRVSGISLTRYLIGYCTIVECYDDAYESILRAPVIQP